MHSFPNWSNIHHEIVHKKADAVHYDHEAKKDKMAHLQADIVIGVPDSSTSAAIGYAKESGLPFNQLLNTHKVLVRSFSLKSILQNWRYLRHKNKDM